VAVTGSFFDGGSRTPEEMKHTGTGTLCAKQAQGACHRVRLWARKDARVHDSWIVLEWEKGACGKGKIVVKL